MNDIFHVLLVMGIENKINKQDQCITGDKLN